MEKKIRVLIVDDEEDLLEVSALNIEIEGHEVYTATGGKEALEFLKNQPVDLIISDIRMADGDGIFLLEELRKKDLETPLVLLVTGFSTLTREEALKKGAYDLMEKPIDFNVINKILSDMNP